MPRCLRKCKYGERILLKLNLFHSHIAVTVTDHSQSLCDVIYAICDICVSIKFENKNDYYAHLFTMDTIPGVTIINLKIIKLINKYDRCN